MMVMVARMRKIPVVMVPRMMGLRVFWRAKKALMRTGWRHQKGTPTAKAMRRGEVRAVAAGPKSPDWKTVLIMSCDANARIKAMGTVR